MHIGHREQHNASGAVQLIIERRISSSLKPDERHVLQIP